MHWVKWKLSYTITLCKQKTKCNQCEFSHFPFNLSFLFDISFYLVYSMRRKQTDEPKYGTLMCVLLSTQFPVLLCSPQIRRLLLLIQYCILFGRYLCYWLCVFYMAKVPYTHNDSNHIFSFRLFTVVFSFA